MRRLIKSTSLAVVAVLLIAACSPLRVVSYGLRFAWASETGEYYCHYVELESSLGSMDEYFNFRYDVDSPANLRGRNIGYNPGLTVNNVELTVTLDCLDDNEVLLGNTVYRVALLDKYKESRLHIYNYLPDDVSLSDCIAPYSHTGGPQFCAIADGFIPIDE